MECNNKALNKCWETLIFGETQSFKKGYVNLKKKDVPTFRQKLMKSLGITTTATFYKAVKGEKNLTIIEAKTIIDLFMEYEITDIWGNSYETR